MVAAGIGYWANSAATFGFLDLLLSDPQVAAGFFGGRCRRPRPELQKEVAALHPVSDRQTDGLGLQCVLDLCTLSLEV